MTRSGSAKICALRGDANRRAHGGGWHCVLARERLDPLRALAITDASAQADAVFLDAAMRTFPGMELGLTETC